MVPFPPVPQDAEEFPLKAIVLTYHSHRVLGADYEANDHVALAEDLELVSGLGIPIVPLSAVVAVARNEPQAGETVVALTFDDGPVYDCDDFVHPTWGPQHGFLSILREFRAHHGLAAQPGLHATSFVIASPQARQAMETSFDATYTYLGPGSMGDGWWGTALASGILDIANHSWDHLHPGLPRVAHSRDVRADFTQVTTDDDADAQIGAAQRFLHARTGGRNAPYFAYPFGHWNAFLAEHWLPRHGVGIEAAFTTDPRPVSPGEDVWRLPRYVCGQHWRTPQSLVTLLQG